MGPGHKELLLSLPSGQGTRKMVCVQAQKSEALYEVPGNDLGLIFYLQMDCNLIVLFL
jgi:hypothetical protein